MVFEFDSWLKIFLDTYPMGVYTVHMNKNKQKLVRRLKLIEGQVRGLQKMIEDEKYCIDVITQTSAVKSALSRVEDELMGSHLSTCVIDQIKDGKERKAIGEIIKVYSLKRK
jgi:DNA-binding FrmR family transcriptional regulator